MASKKVYIKNLGCTRRGLDATRLDRYFRVNGCEVTRHPERADFLVLTTCGFYKPREELSLDAVTEMQQYDGELIVLGCLPSTDPEGLEKRFDGKALPPKRFDEIDGFFPDFKVPFADVEDGHFEHSRDRISDKVERVAAKVRNEFSLSTSYASRVARASKRGLARTLGLDKGQARLRVAHGCLGSCSYCVIRNATGELRSKPLAQLRGEYERLLAEGLRSFAFDGEDTGAYGLDIGLTFASLLDELSTVDRGEDVEWVLHTMNPRWIIGYRVGLEPFIAAGKLSSMEVDIQTGSASVLRAMNRPYDLDELADTLASFKRANARLNIYAQFIVGFPGETERDVQRTIDYIRRIDLDAISIFRYDDMPGTPASELPDKVPHDVREQRYQQLREILDGRLYHF